MIWLFFIVLLSCQTSIMNKLRVDTSNYKNINSKYEVWKVKKVALACMIAMLFIAGCEKKHEKAYTEQIELAFFAISQEKFNKASGYFKIAEKIEPDDEDVQLYMKQLSYIIQANKRKHAGDIEDAVHYLNEAIAMPNGSSRITEKARATKEKILLL